jgi:glycosyltransferase involved in cell wall biosynthesis
LVADFHGSLTREMVSHAYLKTGLLNKVFLWIERFIDNLGDFAIASSGENAEEIKKIRNTKQIEIVLDGVNTDYYKNLPSKSESKKNLELPLDRIIISYTGALVPNKGIAYLFEAMKYVLESGEKPFFILGGFPIEGAEMFVKENKLEKDVRLINPLSYFELPEILNASDIGIDPKDSSSGQASGKILQYMGAGLPIICFDRQNNHDYLGNGAFYAKEISAKSLAETILFALSNSVEIASKGSLNQKRADDFSWNKSAQKINQIYKNINK